MQDELNGIYQTASRLLGEHLALWAESLHDGHRDDEQALAVLQALLTVRGALAPLLDDDGDTGHD
ncbi:hypothetical protein ACPRNU_02880 [Chromobacterium vaccinii]|uniref:hypothetical protein n=1 Tax=Chromobacterium vaccinii TaxID=1108595 RepID=UPI003C71C8D2